MLRKPNFITNSVIAICVIYLSAFMIVSPTKCISSAIGAIQVCGKVVIPSLFPFIFCGNMFIALGAARIMSRYLTRLMHPLFGVSGAGGLALILGIVSGYPVGAACAASLYETGECTKSEAERLIVFCNNSGPMFIIGAVGVGMLKNYNAGIMLYTIHIISAMICGMIFKNFGDKKRPRELPPSRDNNNLKDAAVDMGAAIGQSVNSILKICGFIIIFAVFTAILPETPYKKYIYAAVEITGGINCLIKSGAFSLPIVSAFLSFSGISVLSQVASITTPLKLSLKPYILGKSLQAVISFLLTYLVVSIFPQTLSAFSYNDVSVDDVSVLFVPTPRQLIYTELVSIIFAAITIIVLMVIAKITEKKE